MTEQTPDDPTTDEVRDIWVDWHLNPLPREQGIALVPAYQAAFDRWLAAVVRASGAGLGGTSREQIADALDAAMERWARLPIAECPEADGLARSFRLYQADAVLALRPDPAPDDGTTPDADQPEHRMLPGSHESPRGPECRCGGVWDRWNDRCTTL